MPRMTLHGPKLESDHRISILGESICHTATWQSQHTAQALQGYRGRGRGNHNVCHAMRSPFAHAPRTMPYATMPYATIYPPPLPLSLLRESWLMLLFHNCACFLFDAHRCSPFMRAPQVSVAPPGVAASTLQGHVAAGTTYHDAAASTLSLAEFNQDELQSYWEALHGASSSWYGMGLVQHGIA